MVDVTSRGLLAFKISSLDRPSKTVVDRPANLSTLGLGLLQHRVEGLGLDPEGDVQIPQVLALEVEERAEHLEEGEAGAVRESQVRSGLAAGGGWIRTSQSGWQTIPT